MKLNIFQQKSLLTNAIANAYLSSIDPKHSSIRQTIHELQCDPETGFFADVLLQHKFGYKQVDDTFEVVAQNLNIHKQLTTNMYTSGVYEREWKPFTHQYDAWEHLFDPNETYSIIVSSGTGSGKTECFMVPMFNDFAYQADNQQNPADSLVGVQALMIYPLNALSESQKDRLDGYLQGFNGRIRYAQYNGDTLNTVPNYVQNQTPHQLRDRHRIRETPPPILLTNTTMLELILKRTEDQSILEQSQGTLKYIVLDEAHTYLGSSAANLSMLLRRVLIAFGVNASDVHFIATSATISSAEQDAARLELTKLLADISGQEQSQIKVVFGEATHPILPNAHRSWADVQGDIAQLNPADADYKQTLYALLSNTIEALSIRNAILKKEHTLSELLTSIQRQHPTLSDDDIKTILQYGAIAKDSVSKEFFCPLRIHFFERTQGQLWACSNHDCPGTQEALANDPRWFFGPLFVQYEPSCPHCQAQTYEVTFCASCGQDYLQGECETNGNIVRINQGQPTLLESWNSDQEFEREGHNIETNNDEHAEENEANDDFDDEIEEQVSTYVITRSTDVFSGNHNLDDETLDELEDLGITFGTFNHQTQSFHNNTEGLVDNFTQHAPLVLIPTQREIRDGSIQSYCPCCQNSKKNANIFWSTRRGQKYSIRVNLPLFLKCLPSSSFENNDTPVGDGKQLLSFTDSRAGTANYAMSIQSDIERTWVRSYILHKTVQLSQQNGRATVDALLSSLTNSPELQQLNEFKSTFIGEPYTDAFPANQPLDDLAKILFITFMTRYGQSPEKTGLLEFEYTSINALNPNSMPEAWRQNFSTITEALTQWKNFITIFIDVFIRKNQILNLNSIHSHPIRKRMVFDGNVRHKRLDVTDNTVPQRERQNRPSWYWLDDNGDRRTIPNPSRVVQLLINAFNLDETNDNMDFIDNIVGSIIDILKKCDLLTPVINGDPTQGFAFNLFHSSIVLKPLTSAFFCPTKRTFTNRVLKFGNTLYSPEALNGRPPIEVTLPTQVKTPFPTPEEGLQIEYDLFHNPVVTKARYDGHWSSIADKLVAYTPYIQTAEHSAGLNTSDRTKTEEWFREGKLNVLFCSTTMEMGVDIGGLHGVINSNLPPMSSNYLQRIGRAGRRGEGLSLSLTLCKNMPHDKMAFTNPHWPFTQEIIVTEVKLDSVEIVQRHCNAYLLGCFLQQNPLLIKPNVQKFFYDGGNPVPPAQEFIQYLENCQANVQNELTRIVQNSALERISISDILRQAKETLQLIQHTFEKDQTYFHDSLDGLAPDQQWKNAMFPSLQLWELLQAFPEGVPLPPQFQNIQGQYIANPDVVLQSSAEKAVKAQYRLFLQTDLYTFLTGERFLPSGIQVNGLVKFDYRSVAQLNNARHTDSVPTRPLPIAIREYAPGADIIRQGVAYRSAGVLLKWHQPPYLNNNEIEEIKRHCTQCLGTQHIHNEENGGYTCTTCGHEGSIKIFVPNTFCVDLFENPKLQIDNPLYLSSDTPIPAITGDWSYFYGFQFRTSQDVQILHYNRGINGLGYALCLMCGRTLAEENRAIEGIPGALPSEMQNHRRLRGGNNPDGTPAAICQGCTDEQHAIQRYIKLGGTTKTHGFELQIPMEDGTACNDVVALTSIGFAMKTALAQMIGVEDAELGVHIQTNSILIYDMSDGGAGFSIQAPSHLSKIIDATLHILSCPAYDCTQACEGCLINYGTQYSIEHLNRHIALAVLQQAKSQMIDLSELFLRGIAEPKSITHRYLWSELLAQLEQCSNHVSTVRLYLHGQTEDEFMWTAWGFKRTLERLTRYNIEIVLDQRLLALLQNPDTVLHGRVFQYLAAYIDLHDHISLHSAQLPDLANSLNDEEFFVWGEIILAQHTIRFTSTDDQLVQAHEEWLDTHLYGSAAEAKEFYHFYYTSDINNAYYPTEPVELRHFERDAPQNLLLNSICLEIPKSLEFRPFSSIQTKMFGLTSPEIQTIVCMLQQLKAEYGAPYSVSYSDRYINTPITGVTLFYILMYFRDTLNLINADTHINVTTLETKKSHSSYYHIQKYADNWEDIDSQRKFLEGLCSQINDKSTVSIIQYRRQNVSHARYFQFKWNTPKKQCSLKIYLDQGLDIFKLRADRTIHSFEDIDETLFIQQYNPMVITAISKI